jgi:LmbE family N-acetylglucosaminyl deacetylase
MVYVLCTDGSKGSSDREITQEELVRIREGEQIEAGKVLGLKDVVFLRNEDSMLQPTLELRKDIAREIRRYRPDVVITTHPVRSLDGGWGIGHPDHMAAGEAALAAVFPTARDHMTYPDLLEDGLEPHKVAEVWIMGHPEPDTWVDVTEHIDTSIKALLSHDSQVNGHSPEETANMMREWRRKRAEGKGMQYAEAFKRIPMRR